METYPVMVSLGLMRGFEKVASFESEVHFPLWFSAEEGKVLLISIRSREIPVLNEEEVQVLAEIRKVSLSIGTDNKPCSFHCELGHKHPPLNIICRVEFSEEVLSALRRSKVWEQELSSS